MEVHGACAMLVIFSQPFNPFFLPAALPSALKVSASGIFFERGYSAHANPLLVLRPFASRPSTVPPHVAVGPPCLSQSMLRSVPCNPSCPTTTCACTLTTTPSIPLVFPCIVRLYRQLPCDPASSFLICISPVYAPVPSSTCAALPLKPTSVRRKYAQRRPTMILFCRLCV